MNCKACIHNEVCYAMHTDESPACCDFKDKSLYIELPCKVGDTVYSFCECFGVILPYFVENLNVGYYDKNKSVCQYEANCTNIEENELLDSIDFEFDDIGKTVFYTREEAEKALKEMEKDNG